MRTMSTGTMVGRDGKRYPATHERGGTLPEPERREAITTAHHLVHGLGYSIRAAQRELAAEHGIRRSLGSIHHDLADFVCRDCRDDVPAGAYVTPAADNAW